jgi:hypothetical protein
MFRVVAVGVALVFTRDVVVLAWCVSAPFLVVGLGSALLVRAKANGRYRLDAGLAQLSWNTTRTVASGIAMGALVSGFPALLTASSPGADVARVTSLVFAVNILRSPLVVLTMAFQALLVQRLRDTPATWPTVRRWGLGVIDATAVAALLAATLGPYLSRTLFGGVYALDAVDLGIVVASAAPVAALVIAGSALLARGHHGLYAAGWLTAAVAAIGALAMPLDLTATLIAALIIAPLVGLTIHALAVRQTRPAPPDGRPV